MKHLTGFLALFLFASLTLYAADLSDLTYTTTGGEVTITDCRAAARGELVIPDTIEGNPVTTIEHLAFGYCTNLTSITIPDSVTSIGGRVFENCTNLTSITIPDGVTRIGESTFKECIRLTSITIPDNVALIGRHAFEGCTSLTSITIPNSVTRIEYETFSRCESLTSITIPDGVTSIRCSTFVACTSLTSVVIGNSVNTIGDFAFWDCTRLTSIIFQGSAPDVDDDAFLNVPGGAIATVSAANLSSFGSEGERWNGLILSTPDASDLTWTTTDGEVTITDCDEAATGGLVIPDTIEGNPVTSIGRAAFGACESLTSITIFDSVTSIGREAFLHCTGLTSIAIPDSVTNIGRGAFRGCSALTTIEVAAGNVNYTEVNGVLFDTEMTLLHTYLAAKTGANYVIPDSVTSIGDSAFFDSSSLTSITIGNGVTSIRDEAFRDCTSLTSITIPDSVTRIGEGAFESCTSLTRISIPDSVSSIGIAAFYDCTSLTSITFQGSAPDVGFNAFLSVAGGAIATVSAANLSSFGSEGESWNGLILSTADQSDAIIADLEVQLTAAIAERDAAIAERDARPTAEALATVEAESDAILSDIQLAFDEVNAAAGGAEADLVVGIVDPANAPSEVQSVGVIAQPREAFEVNTFASPANLDTEMALYDSAGTLIANNDDAGPAVQSQLNFSDGLAGGVYYLAVGTYNSTFNSDFAVSSNGRGGEYTLTLPTGPVSGTLEASGFDWYCIEIGTNFAALQLQPLTELYRNLVEANASAISERDAAIAERDARFTEDQIRSLSADYTIGLNNAGNVQMKFNLFESADLNTFAPLTLNPDSVSVVDGSICLEFTPEDRAAFFRFSVE